MRVITFYVRSQNVIPHINVFGEVHVPVSMFSNVISTTWTDKASMKGVKFLEYPTNALPRSETMAAPVVTEKIEDTILSCHTVNYRANNRRRKPTNGTTHTPASDA